ncbi:sigma-70 family RNA polymerase sigma factor [Eubacteriaceae bacterium ES3]|nr:sigma-70 family RNA polymerase sigma factor [Eubacteriaceae bacterium ES3]
MKVSEFDRCTDDEIISKAQDGDKDAAQFLLKKYRKLVSIRSRSYYLIGSDYEDLIQEGMIGLLKAIWDYQPNRNVKFDTFAGLCIERQIQTAVTSANRLKHQILNQSVSIYSTLSKEDGDEIIEFLQADSNTDPVTSLVNDEALLTLVEMVKKELSEFEKKILLLYINGESYIKIAELLNCNTKSVDNALQRIRKKIGSHL